MSRHQGVEALLRELVPADPRERQFVEDMRGLLAEQSCFDRDHYIPGHFTASAFVLAPTADALLLIHHRKLGRWLQPGGHFEADDPGALEAALREVTEETGVHALRRVGTGLLDADIHDIPPHKEIPSHRHFDLRFLFQALDPSLAPTAEVAGARWFPFDELDLSATDESVLRAVRKIRRALQA